MRGIWGGLALSALTLGTGARLAGADDLGCCEAECHWSDDAGRVLHSLQRNAMTESECESRFHECKRTWEAHACDTNPDAHLPRGGTVMRDGGDE